MNIHFFRDSNLDLTTPKSLDLHPPPRMQSSPPGWHDFFFKRESRTKPLFATIATWKGSRSNLYSWSWRVGKALKKVFPEENIPNW